MELSTLTALSPLDGRYAAKLAELRPIASEYGLIYHRLQVEIEWLLALAADPKITGLTPLEQEDRDFLQNILKGFSLNDAEQVKTIEQTTNHDVKAVEYFLSNRLTDHPKLCQYIPFIHFGCTSEDINNVAYGLMLSKLRSQILSPCMSTLLDQLHELAQSYAKIPMLTRTHGQPASPSTLGKEIANVHARLQRQFTQWQALPILAKFNGATGNFNAHAAAYPELNWTTISQSFIASLGLDYNPMTTQIEPHDNLAEWLHTLARFNTIMIDLNRDIWGYISLGYFGQRRVEGEVGSSTMPHKVNPIDFENSEGNLGIANALANHLAAKLPISRWQRDLSDSTVLRNLGSIAGYAQLAYQSTLKGLGKLTVNPQVITDDLNQHWEILGEAIQTVLRRYGVLDAYERLKALTRGADITADILQQFITELPLPEETKKTLHNLTPEQYIGYAAQLTEHHSSISHPAA